MLSKKEYDKPCTGMAYKNRLKTRQGQYYYVNANYKINVNFNFTTYE